MKTKNLLIAEEAKSFYEERYSNGYMDEWPIEQKKRVFEVLTNLDLPSEGIALDFGCGNGVFTEILKQALPKWKIYGCDISINAIDNAKRRVKNCNFFIGEDQDYSHLQFDLLFSHHVLEHVFDLKASLEQINSFLKPVSSILYIFPCGNQDSFEYKISKMRINGINEAKENRFFFEDEGHVRRLTTLQMDYFMAKYGFQLTNEFYSNQYFGAIKWISQSYPSLILDFTDSTNAVDADAERYLRVLRIKLFGLFLQ